MTAINTKAEVSDAAWDAYEAGLCVVPPKEDGSKRPDGQWKQYQTERPDEPQMTTWYGWDDRHGLGVLCGTISGGLEMFEFEGRAVEAGLFDRWISACSDAGLDELLDRVLNGYQEHTPSGGVHLLWRCGTVPGNTKVARDPDGVVLVETRGEGGFTILAPSGGTVHPSGKAWTLVRGGFATIPTITESERAALVDLARTLDDYRPDEIAVAEPAPRGPEDIVWDAIAETLARYDSNGGSWMDSVIDDYTRRTTWRDVLVGWSELFTRGGVTYWRRPGKDDGHSATTNAKGTDRFINFSSSVPHFEPWDGVGKATSYSKFDVYAQLAHGGDRVGAARKLRAQGYGATSAPQAPALAPPTVDPTDDTPPDIYDLLAKPDDPFDWVVEGLLERHDRVILTGGEGKGKSTFLRQFAVKIAAGLNPFTDDEIPPVRTLIVDLENSERQIRRKMRPLVDLANDGNDLDRQMLFVVPRPQGLNLFDAPDLDWLGQQLDTHRPEVLIIGPLYKMADGDPTEEAHAKAISGAIDAVRVAYRCAVVIEAHSPHGTPKNRPLRPYGASLWLRWPEFGIGLTDAGQLQHWRGQRDERSWPVALERSAEYGVGWPWTAASDSAAKWAVVKDFIRGCDEWPSRQDIADGTGIPKTTVNRQITANRKEYDAMKAEMGADQ